MALTNVATAGRTPDRLGLGMPFEESPRVSVGMIAREVMPVTPVAKKNATFNAITREGWLRRRDTRRGSGGAFARDGVEYDEIEYNCKGNGFEVPVTKDQREVYVSDFDADMDARDLIKRVLDAEHEIRVAGKIFNATTWLSTDSDLYTDVSTDWDSSSATIIADVAAAIEKVRRNSGMLPNTMVLSAAHLRSLRINTQLQGQFKGGAGDAIVTYPAMIAALPQILGIPRILMGGGVYNSGGEGEDLSVTDIWADTYAWIGIVPEGNSLNTPGVGRTLQWQAFGGDGFEWQNYEEPQTKTDVWQAEHWTDEKVIDKYFGHLLKIDT